MKIRAVIFDIDDTLVSEHAFMLSGYMAAAKKAEELLPDVWQDIYEKLLSLSDVSTKNVFNRLLDGYHLYYDEDDVKDLVKIYHEHMPVLEFHRDVIPAVMALKGRGIMTGIISDGIPVMQHNKIHACSGEQYFDQIIITDEMGGTDFRKPDPRSFDRMAALLKTDISEMLYVGDNPEKDFYIMHYRNIQTARIIRPDSIYADRKYREDIMETYRIESLEELVGLVG